MKNAIVVLTRGYRNPDQYETLIQRNIKIKEFFGDKYPVILFHEGNIKDRHQRDIFKRSGMNIQFRDISSVWTGGYEGMCRFYAYDIWELCKDYDYILRIDEDCMLQQVERDPFAHIGNNVYLKSCFFAESHSETNATLPLAIEGLTGAKANSFYNDKFVYTNVGLSSVEFWRTGEVAEVLKTLATSSSQRIYRWGDLPLLGSLLNIYAPNRIGTLTGVTYSHLSHGNVIECQ